MAKNNKSVPMHSINNKRMRSVDSDTNNKYVLNDILHRFALNNKFGVPKCIELFSFLLCIVLFFNSIL